MDNNIITPTGNFFTQSHVRFLRIGNDVENSLQTVLLRNGR